MNATASDAADAARRAAHEMGSDLRRRSGNMRDATRSELGAFFADVEDLVKQVANVSDADVARLRAKVATKLSEVRRTAGDATSGLRDRARMAYGVTDDYVRDQPWTAVGVAAAMGLLVGISVAAVARR